MLQLVYAVSVLPQPWHQPTGSSPLQPQSENGAILQLRRVEALSSELMVKAVAARLAAKQNVMRRPELVCLPETEVAVLVASDIRMDPDERTRPDQVERINLFTAGSSLFIHTDLAFKDDVDTYFKHAVAVRYTEEEEGGIPVEFAAGHGKTAGRRIQWWRLSRAWDLLSDYEEQCKHSHSFVMKMRLDSAFNDKPRSLSNLYQDVIEPTFGSDGKAAFASSDRFFAGSHEAFGVMAQFGDKWNTTYKDNLGFCGTCNGFAQALAHLDSTPRVFEVALDTDLLASHRDGCVMVEQPPHCAKVCKPTATTSQLDKACPLHASDVEVIDRGERILTSHNFGRGGSIVDMTLDELAAARQNATGSACYVRGPTREGGSELMFAFHIFFSGLSPRSITQLDDSIWSPRQHNLVKWRHPLILWSDGFTIDDGPLLSYEVSANANFAAELHTSISAPACISTSELRGVIRRWYGVATAEQFAGMVVLDMDHDEDDEDDEDDGCYTVQRVEQPHARAVFADK